VIWGIPYLLIKIADAGVSVPVLVFARVFVGAVLLLLPTGEPPALGDVRDSTPGGPGDHRSGLVLRTAMRFDHGRGHVSGEGYRRRRGEFGDADWLSDRHDDRSAESVF